MDYTIYGVVIVGRAVYPNGAVAVKDGIIVYSGDRSDAPVMGQETDFGKNIIVPGFIDIHCHAGGDKWFYEDPAFCADFHLAHGTTSMCATLYRDMSIEDTVKAIAEKGSKPSDCVKCGACEAVCPQKIKIRDFLCDITEELDK